jgi:hypothetical protein
MTGPLYDLLNGTDSRHAIQTGSVCRNHQPEYGGVHMGKSQDAKKDAKKKPLKSAKEKKLAKKLKKNA